MGNTFKKILLHLSIHNRSTALEGLKLFNNYFDRKQTTLEYSYPKSKDVLSQKLRDKLTCVVSHRAFLKKRDMTEGLR